jgi:photosynthetic reaction center cytochrome c subunit
MSLPYVPYPARIVIAVGAAVAGLFLFTLERPPVDVVQRGFRGLAMEQNYNPRTFAKVEAANQAPVPFPAVPQVGGKAGAVYKNVQVLKDLPVTEFTRLMASMTTWVAPTQGCTYCHVDANNLASDDIYTKKVSRRMLQMVLDINTNYKTHVASSGPTGANGVTCYTCHRGQPVPANIWFTNPTTDTPVPSFGYRAGKDLPSMAAGLTSLETDPYTPYFLQSDEIRITGKAALPDTAIGNAAFNLKPTYWSYGVMISISKALGVNCTYCHNTRQFADWAESTPQRATAWYGIRMVRHLNNDYLVPLQSVFPASRLGPTGDSPKVNCATCHNGVYKPLFGTNLVQYYPELTK